ncbi:MAG: class I SAM-dependent methyltransferase [bacterium]
MILWDWKAYSYDFFRNLFPFKQILLQEIKNIKELLSHVNIKQGTILDVGTGTGTILELLHRDCKVFAVDKSIRMIHKAKLKQSTNFVVGDATTLPFKSYSFNLVTAVGLFEYQKEPVKFLQELQRLIEPTGCVVITYSQLSGLNILRYLLGHQIYLKAKKSFNHLLSHSGFAIKMIKKTLVQRQVLIINKSD